MPVVDEIPPEAVSRLAVDRLRAPGRLLVTRRARLPPPASRSSDCQTVSNSIVKVEAAPSGATARRWRVAKAGSCRPAATSGKTSSGSFIQGDLHQPGRGICSVEGVAERAGQGDDRGAADQQVVDRGVIAGVVGRAVGDGSIRAVVAGGPVHRDVGQHAVDHELLERPLEGRLGRGLAGDGPRMKSAPPAG